MPAADVRGFATRGDRALRVAGEAPAGLIFGVRDSRDGASPCRFRRSAAEQSDENLRDVRIAIEDDRRFGTRHLVETSVAVSGIDLEKVTQAVGFDIGDDAARTVRDYREPYLGIRADVEGAEDVLARIEIVSFKARDDLGADVNATAGNVHVGRTRNADCARHGDAARDRNRIAARVVHGHAPGNGSRSLLNHGHGIRRRVDDGDGGRRRVLRSGVCGSQGDRC